MNASMIPTLRKLCLQWKETPKDHQIRIIIGDLLIEMGLPCVADYLTSDRDALGGSHVDGDGATVKRVCTCTDDAVAFYLIDKENHYRSIYRNYEQGKDFLTKVGISV